MSNFMDGRRGSREALPIGLTPALSNTVIQNRSIRRVDRTLHGLNL